MRIGLFTDTYFPRLNGVAISVRMLKENLEAQGHEVYVYTTTDPDAHDNEQRIFRVPSIPFKTQRLGTFVSPALRQMVKKLKPDIIHTHTEYTLGGFGRKLAQKLNIPYVHTMHTIYEYYTNYIVRSEHLGTPAKYVVRKLTASYCNSADVVVTPTEKNKDLLVTYGVKKPIKVIPSGIQLEKFCSEKRDFEKINAIKAELGIMDDERVLLNIGRVAHEKNLDELLTGLENYLKQHNDVKLVIVGDGLAREKLERISDETGISAQVIFAGARPWDEISQYYRIGDVFVGASLSETQGLTYIEAMASGLPVVAKEDRCLEGVLSNGENGYFFNNSNGLVAAVDKLLSDRGVLESFSKNAIETAQAFSAEAYAHKMEEVYQDMLKVN